MVLNTGPRDWESSALTIRSLLYCLLTFLIYFFFRAEKIRNSDARFFVRLVETFGAPVHQEKTFNSLDFFSETVHHIVM